MNEHLVENPFAPPETQDSVRQVLVIHENVDPHHHGGLKRCAMALNCFLIQGWLLFGAFSFWLAKEHLLAEQLGLVLMIFAGIGLMVAYAVGVLGTAVLMSVPRPSGARVAFVLATILMLIPIGNNCLIYLGVEFPQLPRADFPPLSAMQSLDQLITFTALYFGCVANVIGMGRLTSFISIVNKSPMSVFVFGIQCVILSFMAIGFWLGPNGGSVTEVFRHAVNVLAIVGAMAYFVVAYDCRRRILRAIHRKP